MSDEHEIPVKVVDRRWWARGEDSEAAAADRTSLKPTYVEELERQLADKDKLAQEYLGKYRQAAQEFEDARARMRKEIAKDAERSRREILVSLLDVVDNLDRALDAARRSGTSASDPLVHEAVTAVPAADASQDGCVVGVVRPGYTIGEEVLRPALVAVAKQ